jgi:hypothetical protein
MIRPEATPRRGRQSRDRRGEVALVQVHDHVPRLREEKMPSPAATPSIAGTMADRARQADAERETRHHGLGDEVGDRLEAQEAGEHEDDRGHQGERGREGGEGRRVAVGERPDCGGRDGAVEVVTPTTSVREA